MEGARRRPDAADSDPSPAVRTRARELMADDRELTLLEALAAAEAEIEDSHG